MSDLQISPDIYHLLSLPHVFSDQFIIIFVGFCSQEGVSSGIYKPIEVQVETPAGDKLTCRSYQLLILNAKDPRPSPHYLDVIKRGARQNGLPAEYLQFLDNIEHNGYEGEVKMYNNVLAMLKEHGVEVS